VDPDRHQQPRSHPQDTLHGLSARTVFARAGLTKYDVVHKILEVTRRLPFPLAWEHVKSHQDDITNGTN
jgi:hypothetical protein